MSSRPSTVMVSQGLEDGLAALGGAEVERLVETEPTGSGDVWSETQAGGYETARRTSLRLVQR